MKRRLLTLLILIATLASLSAKIPSKIADETLRYKVLFRWGLIHKQAGTATLSITSEGDHYLTRLTARSDPWADRFFRLRDTLTGQINRQDFRPQRYENIAHEDGDYKHDVVTYDHSTPGVVKAVGTHRAKKKRANDFKTQTVQLEAKGVALDMLSMYYYMRFLDYDQMAKGATTKLHIFSGRKKELLTINYEGKSDIKIGKTNHHTYHIRFTFTTDNGRETSDPMDAWISTDPARIPLQMEGKLKVGKVQCVFTGH